RPAGDVPAARPEGLAAGGTGAGGATGSTAAGGSWAAGGQVLGVRAPVTAGAPRRGAGWWLVIDHGPGLGGGQVGRGVAQREGRVPGLHLGIGGTARPLGGTKPRGACGGAVPRGELARWVDRVRLARPWREAADGAAPAVLGRTGLLRWSAVSARCLPGDGQAWRRVARVVRPCPVRRLRARRGGSLGRGTPVAAGEPRPGGGRAVVRGPGGVLRPGPAWHPRPAVRHGGRRARQERLVLGGGGGPLRQHGAVVLAGRRRT